MLRACTILPAEEARGRGRYRDVISRKTTIVEESLLVLCGLASKQAVAVRESAEPADDLGVLPRVFQVLGIVGVLKQRDAVQMVGQLLGMHEGHIEEFEQGRVDPAICAAPDRAAGDIPRQRVAGKGLRCAAKHVAGKLVEHDDERERAVVIVFP